MASKKNRARAARDANPRKFKKKTSVLVIDKVEYIDYKDVDLLQRFMSDRAKIRNRRVAGNNLQQQREVANAIKIAREMALLPYAKRVASTRTGGRRGESRGSRDESRGSRDESRGPRDESRGSRDESRGPRDESRGPRDDAARDQRPGDAPKSAGEPADESIDTVEQAEGTEV